MSDDNPVRPSSTERSSSAGDLAAAAALTGRSAVRLLLLLVGAVLRHVFPGFFAARSPVGGTQPAGPPQQVLSVPAIDAGGMADEPQGATAEAGGEDSATVDGEDSATVDGEDSATVDGLPQRNPDLRGMATLALAVLGAIGAAVAASELGSPLDLTQYWLGASAVVLVGLEIADGGEGGSRRAPTRLSQRGLIIRCLVFSAITVTAFVCRPNLYLAWADCVFFWLSALSMWKCTAGTILANGPLWGRVLSAVVVLKRMFGGRRGARGAIAFGLIVFTAVSSTLGASVATVAEIKATQSRPSVPLQGDPPPGPRSPNIVAGGQGQASGNQTSSAEASAPEWDGQCGAYEYPNVPTWAVQELGGLLRGAAGLGPMEEGCVEKLTYDSRSEFAWGEGVNPVSGSVLSIVFDSRLLPPAIVLAPAVPAVRHLVRKYQLLGGSGSLFPRHRTGSGDYYLLDTANEGSCVVIRSRSGSAAEAPPYTTLYPSAVAAWIRSIEIKHKWQWVVESAAPDKKHEVVYELFAAGSAVRDGTITYNPDSGVAKWDGYPYVRAQRDIEPEKIQELADRYLDR